MRNVALADKKKKKLKLKYPKTNKNGKKAHNKNIKNVTKIKNKTTIKIKPLHGANSHVTNLYLYIW